jgi:hypothetical protein
MLQDKPDFQAVRRTAGGALYQRYLGGTHWILFPNSLEIARRPDDTPDFQIDLVRSAAPGLAAFGIVDFRVNPVFDFDQALADSPDLEISRGYFSGGWLRLLVREPSKTESATILPPQQISSVALGAARLASRMTSEGVSLLKRALLDRTLLLEAWAEMLLEGIAPRFPYVVVLEAPDLERLRKLTAATKSARRSDLVGAIADSTPLANLPVENTRTEIAEAVADRLLSLLGVPAPSPENDFAECWCVAWDVGQTRLLFDLSQPLTATRVTALRFDPAAFLRTAVDAGGVERLILQRELPDFRTGYLAVLVTATLPDVRTPALSCGVDILAAPKPPKRLSAIRETVEFEPPRDRHEVILHFAADEEPTYEIQTFVYTQTELGVLELRGPRRPYAGNEIRLTPQDFPVRFVPVTASLELLQEGDVSLTARTGQLTQTISLNAQRRTDSLVVEHATQLIGFVCRLEAPQLDLKATLPNADHLFLDLSIFREFGSHRVLVKVDFAGGPEVVALEFKPENAPDSSATTLAFTRAKSEREFSWFAKSPRSPGYRYRRFDSDNPGPWSEPRSPFEPLLLKAVDLQKPVVATGGTP